MQPGSSMDGTELVRQLKSHLATRVAVVVTSRIEPELRVAASAAGCDAFLLLPCVPDDLIATIKEVLPVVSPT
jgi:CheY-like chemotaxis protein